MASYFTSGLEIAVGRIQIEREATCCATDIAEA
jgi:hypothetical protein